MCSLTKQVFILLLSFSSTLACNQRKSLFLDDKPCMVRSTIIDMNPVELKYYTFMVSLNKSTGSYNVLSPKICVPKDTKDINVNAFSIITNKNEAKAMAVYISCDCKGKLNSTACNSNQKLNSKTCQCEWKNYHTYKKD